jgi:osmotically-inducible protein OsmY
VHARLANDQLLGCSAFRGRGNSVHCHSENRCLVLEGMVPTFYLKQLAQEAVRNVPGYERIDNRIVVANLWEDSSR